MRKLLFFAAFVVLACESASAQTTAQPIRINCGGNGYTDSKGQSWQADVDFSGGNTGKSSIAVAGTHDPALFQTARYAGSSPLIYSIPVPTGAYHVNFYFAETNPSFERVGGRFFNVKLEGNTVFHNLDVFATAGANTALVRGADVLVTDGKLQIEFDNVVQSAEINAIEVTQTISMPPMRMTFVYPDGTPVTGFLNYQITPVNGGKSMTGSEPLVQGQATALLMNSPKVLGLIGTLNVSMSLTDTTGKTLWQIAMSMNPSNVSFAAVQSTTLQVVVQKQ